MYVFIVPSLSGFPNIADIRSTGVSMPQTSSVDLTHGSFPGEIVYVVAQWTYVPFLGAVDCKLLGSSLPEQASPNDGCSRDDPPCMGNI